jgi:hypothetical protein
MPGGIPFSFPSVKMLFQPPETVRTLLSYEIRLVVGLPTVRASQGRTLLSWLCQDEGAVVLQILSLLQMPIRFPMP